MLIAYKIRPIVRVCFFQVVEFHAQLQFRETYRPIININSTGPRRHQRWIQCGKPLNILLFTFRAILKCIHAQLLRDLDK